MKKHIILNRLLQIRNLNFKFFPLRVKRFRKEKWAFLKKSLNFQFRDDTYNSWRKLVGKRTKKTNKFLHFLKIKRSYRLNRISRTYKTEQNEKRALNLQYNGAIKNKYRFKQTSYDTIKHRITFLIKPNYRQDIILWYLNFFENIIVSKFFIKQGAILINNKRIRGCTFINKGDVLCVEKHIPNIKNLRKKYYKSKKLFSFIELDYYTNTVIIVKSEQELWLSDFSLISQSRKHLKFLKCRY